ncbi:MAG TPA: MBL fold metallo-hydrolase [Pyrinomonadaceae bacterium]|nr:MBL fold metallo-hydrolase [Pyrinomonadaceae bacterium]
MFNLEMLPADHGDCLWIKYGQGQEQHQILIDGGTTHSFASLRERISGLPPAERHFELFVITHIDSDHIGGALELLRHVDTLGVTFGDVWFNGWEHIAPFNLSPLEGEYVADNIQERGLNWNKAFGEKVIVVPDNGALPSVTLDGGMKLTLMSPTGNGLARLKERWYEVITAEELKPGEVKDEEAAKGGLLLGDDTPDMEALLKVKFRGDRAPANGSSIALLAEYEGKRCLLTGDAYAPVLAASIKRLNDQEGREKLQLSAFKVSHHGSRGNINDKLLNLLDCNRYLFSTNGMMQFRHPHRESVARVIKFGGYQPELNFNYRSDINKVWDDRDLMDRYEYRVRYGDEPTPGTLLVEL